MNTCKPLLLALGLALVAGPLMAQSRDQATGDGSEYFQPADTLPSLPLTVSPVPRAHPSWSYTAPMTVADEPAATPAPAARRPAAVTRFLMPWQIGVF